MENDPVRALAAKAVALRLGAPDQTTPKPQPYLAGYCQRYRTGWLLWSPATGACYVGAVIAARWWALGGAAGFLGFPLTDELPVGREQGRFADFQGGSIYWRAQSGAVVIHGLIRDCWAGLGGATGVLGFPTGDQAHGKVDRQIVQPFVGGVMVCSGLGGVADQVLIRLVASIAQVTDDEDRV